MINKILLFILKQRLKKYKHNAKWYHRQNIPNWCHQKDIPNWYDEQGIPNLEKQIQELEKQMESR